MVENHPYLHSLNYPIWDALTLGRLYKGLRKFLPDMQIDRHADRQSGMQIDLL